MWSLFRERGIVVERWLAEIVGSETGVGADRFVASLCRAAGENVLLITDMIASSTFVSTEPSLKCETQR